MRRRDLSWRDNFVLSFRDTSRVQNRTASIAVHVMNRTKRQPDATLSPEVLEQLDPEDSGAAATALARGLGRREREIMKVLWARGSASVMEVGEHLSTALAYTTVMTTLDRLFKKGLLQREKRNRAFIYSAKLSSAEVEKQRAAGLVRRFFADSRERPEILLSCLVDAVDQYDAGLLDELEARIRAARAQAVESSRKTEDTR